MKNNVIDDFTYDFTKYLEEHMFWIGESSKDIILRFYLFTHQFCNNTIFETRYLPIVFKDFLEENEEVFINEFNNKIYFKIKNYKDKELQDRIKFVLKTLSLSIIDIKDENNLEITYKKYDNTNNRGINETIYH
jgi:hypothetical protein